MTQFATIELTISDHEKQFLKEMELLKEQMCNVFQIPSCMIEGYKETRWNKIKRNVRLFVWRIGEKLKSKKRNKDFSKSSLSEAIRWMTISEGFDKWYHNQRRWRF